VAWKIASAKTTNNPLLLSDTTPKWLVIALHYLYELDAVVKKIAGMLKTFACFSAHPHIPALLDRRLKWRWMFSRQCD
jgi:hypothetical protein